MNHHIHDGQKTATFPTYRAWIGKRKAAPTHCPICGTASLPPPADDIMSLLKSVYSHPNRIFSMDVPGWKGFRSWYYECVHGDPMASIMYMHNPVFDFIKNKGDADFSGRSYMLPITLTYNR